MHTANANEAVISADHALPLPRLRHIEPGQFFTLRHDPEVRVLLHKTSTHGHFNNGYASLCHELERSCVVWGENGWEAKP